MVIGCCGLDAGRTGAEHDMQVPAVRDSICDPQDPRRC